MCPVFVSMKFFMIFVQFIGISFFFFFVQFTRISLGYEGKTENFDLMLEGNKLTERSDNESKDEEENEGILPVLIRTAKDDFKLVGDAIRMAFSKR